MGEKVGSAKETSLSTYVISNPLHESHDDFVFHGCGLVRLESEEFDRAEGSYENSKCF